MPEALTRGEQNLYLLQSLIPNRESFYIWCYAADGRLIGYSCPAGLRETLDSAFRAMGGYDKMLGYAAAEDYSVPKLIGSSVGLTWAVTLETERKRSLLFVIGPVFQAPADGAGIRNTLLAEAGFSAGKEWIEPFCALIPLLPVMSYAVFARYVMLVHNTLTGQQLGLEALHSEKTFADSRQEATVSQRNRLEVYQSEKAMLEMVRRGDINYFSAFSRSSSLSPGVPVHGRDPLRQMKTSVTVFTTLVTRAAMEGGLSPEIAYPLGDSYIQTAEDCRDSGELASLANAMYHDFIYRVHQLHTNPSYSHAIQKCCDYIELSLDRRIQAKDLATLVGYTEYYLTEKFRQETGMSVSEYTRQAKINRAKTLLRTTDLSISQISERLAFNTPNYFIHVFRELEGCTPAVFRQRLDEQNEQPPQPVKEKKRFTKR